MKKILNLFILLALLLMLVSCSEDNSSAPETNTTKTFEELEIPDNFDWVTGNRVNFNVSLISQNLPLNLDGKRINLVDQNDIVITSRLISNMEAAIPAVIPSNVNSLYLHIPAVNQKIEVVNNGDDQDVTFEIIEVLEAVVVNNDSKAQRNNPIGNYDFETLFIDNAPNSSYSPPVDGNWWQFSAGVQTCDIVEEFDNTSNHVLKMVPQCFAFQTINVNPHDNANLVFSIRNPDENFVTLSVNFSYYDINGDPVGTQALNLNAAQHDMDNTWTQYTTAFVIPENSTTLTLSFHSHNWEPDYYYLDNVEYEAVSGDTDGDGVIDDDDDYPNDPERAYRVLVPYSGRRIIAFEDLWPDKGDYDFNDMVIGSRLEYALNAQNQYVDMQGSVRYRGLGANYHNGLGLRFINVANNGVRNVYTPLTNDDFVEDVSHNIYLDNYESNSVIITGDVFQQINGYYQNNGIGPDGTPHEHLFTVDFDINADQPLNLTEDFFIYQAGHRGREIHLPYRPATDGSNQNIYMTGDDATDPNADYWYQTINKHPWGIEILSTEVNFLHPLEYVPITRAYPEFSAWAESGGVTNTEWYLNPEDDEVYIFGR